MVLHTLTPDYLSWLISHHVLQHYCPLMAWYLLQFHGCMPLLRDFSAILYYWIPAYLSQLSVKTISALWSYNCCLCPTVQLFVHIPVSHYDWGIFIVRQPPNNHHSICFCNLSLINQNLTVMTKNTKQTNKKKPKRHLKTTVSENMETAFRYTFCNFSIRRNIPQKEYLVSTFILY